MTDVLELVTKYGLKAVIIAVATILMIGLVKVVLKEQLQGLGKEKCKALYESLSIIIISMAVLGYYGAVKLFGFMEVTFTWEIVIGEIVGSYTVVKILYPLYENFGIRKLLQMIGAAIFTKKVKEATEKVDTKVDTKEGTDNSSDNSNDKSENKTIVL